MRWGKGAVAAVTTLALAVALGAVLATASHPSPANTSTPTVAVTRPAGAAAPLAERPRPERPAAPPTTPATTPITTTPTTTTTTVPGPGSGFTAANPANPYVKALAVRLAPVSHADPGCILVTQGKSLLYQSNATEPFAPGSTQKLLVAAAALQVLGPDYTFSTEVVAPAAPVDGVVANLWLVGGGDPVLEEPAYNAWLNAQPRYRGDPFTDIDTLAQEVRAKVTTVTGSIYGDDARYDAERLSPYWPADTEADGNINPISALSLNEGYAYWLAGPSGVPADPASYAAARFAQILHETGVNDPDRPAGTDGVPPAGSVVIASIQSPPLSQIIGAMLRPSDNQIAEMLVKELGYHATGEGTTAAGLAVVKSVDTRLGVPWEGTKMYDGSGLSHDDRSTCRTLLAAFYLGDKPRLSALRQVSVGGEDGTLAERFLTPPLRGHILAKTGTIDGAGALVGEIDLAEPVRFAVVFNQAVPDYQLIDYEDAAVDAIAPYP